MAQDNNGDKWPDIVVGNKKGAFVHRKLRESARNAWLKAQPKPYKAD